MTVLIQDGAVNQADNEHSGGFAVGIIVAGADVENGVASGIQRSGTFEGHTDEEGIPGIGTVIQVQEINIAVQGGVDHFHQVFLGLLGFVQVHDCLGFLRPLDNQGLTGPAAAGPTAIHGGKVAGIDGPGGGDSLLGNRSRTVGCAVTEVVAAEGGNAGQGEVFVGVAEVDQIFPLVFGDETASVEDLPVNFPGGRVAVFGHLGGKSGKVIGLRRLCGRFRGRFCSLLRGRLSGRFCGALGGLLRPGSRRNLHGLLIDIVVSVAAQQKHHAHQDGGYVQHFHRQLSGSGPVVFRGQTNNAGNQQNCKNRTDGNQRIKHFPVFRGCRSFRHGKARDSQSQNHRQYQRKGKNLSHNVPPVTFIWVIVYHFGFI